MRNLHVILTTAAADKKSWEELIKFLAMIFRK
jgi:hypothetical protein